ncbi:hypothetical protein CCAL9344_05820 [Campylobacter sp. RM9344]|uniref:DUF4376 domain protein n=1 Tax=Campylobacter californiensis TaxID=1032243 RepID=A0AAW3ZRU3_9BACT|nr:MULTISPECIES: hypothetical protein [unclassified Campylobacter]MBE2985447.1 hypothetical protein [Campylobacter sp. RM6883]MBE2994557.1 hypothetical protein [Campylobacter sp. RM6913]MBE3029697.1 hypothetical protein [Campylobacter sp. RM9344]MBE3607182.1 hypothetical protein [Campylobacter sp. RM9337]MBE3609518.1 hypothetical protein [Campylobacter sp. RM12916]
MKYYKDKQNQIYAYDDDVSDEFLNVKIAELGLKKLSKKEEQELSKPKEPSLEELKQAKLSSLELWFETMKNKSKIDFKGFGIIDGGYKYLLNASAMVENYELLPQKVFRMWDDSFKPIDLNGLKAIKRAIELAGIKLHSIKWEYEARIASANDKDELEAIVFYDVIEIDLGASNE